MICGLQLLWSSADQKATVTHWIMYSASHTKVSHVLPFTSILCWEGCLCHSDGWWLVLPGHSFPCSTSILSHQQAYIHCSWYCSKQASTNQLTIIRYNTWMCFIFFHNIRISRCGHDRTFHVYSVETLIIHDWMLIQLSLLWFL